MYVDCCTFPLIRMKLFWLHHNECKWQSYSFYVSYLIHYHVEKSANISKPVCSPSWCYNSSGLIRLLISIPVNMRHTITVLLVLFYTASSESGSPVSQMFENKDPNKRIQTGIKQPCSSGEILVFGGDGAHVTELSFRASQFQFVKPKDEENRTGWDSSWGRSRRFRLRNIWAGARDNGRLWAFGRRALLLLSAQLHLGEFIWAGKSGHLGIPPLLCPWIPCRSLLSHRILCVNCTVTFIGVMLAYM